MRKIAILGSTGSIGTQALDVLALHEDRYAVCALLAHSNSALLFEQVRRFRPQMAGLVVEPKEIPEDLRGVEWVFGKKCLAQMTQNTQADDILVSVVGIAGLEAVMMAIARGKRVLLANKEPLVAGGELVMNAARENNVSILPIDSEHSAIFQCLQGAGGNIPRGLYLTASGGPFRTWAKDDIRKATKAQALRHPNWTMGQKITIDSASMMNKALEIIEARWLFDMAPEKIRVLVHPQSVIHSMVEYEDGAVIAQLGTPDMRLPILYAISYPERLPTGGERLDFSKMASLTFEMPDTERFPALRLAYDVLKQGGTAGAIFNGANEVAVAAFLKEEISFGAITDIVEKTLSRVPGIANPNLAQVFEADRLSRVHAEEIMKTLR